MLKEQEYIVTVHYSLRVRAESSEQAESKVCGMDLGPDYVTDSFEITDVHASQSAKGGIGRL